MLGKRSFLISLLAAVAKSSTKYILPETYNFIAKMIHYEERSKSSTYNHLNFTNPLHSIIESVCDTFIYKEAMSQPDRM